jgi:hypothetical protein
MRRFAGFALLSCCIACPSLQARAQHSPKPLANDDVIKMVHQKLPESVIVSAIHATPGHFDTSPNELIRLHNAGVTEGELNAMMAASGGPAAPGTPASTAICRASPCRRNPNRTCPKSNCCRALPTRNCPWRRRNSLKPRPNPIQWQVWLQIRP